MNTQKFFGTVVLVSLLLGGCAPATAPPAQPTATPTTAPAQQPTVPPTTEPDVVQVGFLPVLSMSPFFIADAEGFFTEQNIVYEWTQIDTMADAVPLLATGRLDVSAGSLNSALLNTVMGGEPVAIVADKGYLDAGVCPSGAIIARSELLTSGALDSAETVRNLTFAGNPITVTAYVFDRWLNDEYGLSINDINVARLPNSALIDSFNNGAIDFASVQEPTMTTILENTDTEVLIELDKYLNGFNYAVVVYGQRLIEENPDLGNRFMVAYLKGVRRYLEGPTERNLEIISAATGVDAETLAGICWPYMRPDGFINYEGSIGWQEWELANDRLVALAPEDRYWNPSFVEYAAGVLGAP